MYLVLTTSWELIAITDAKPFDSCSCQVRRVISFTIRENKVLGS